MKQTALGKVNIESYTLGTDCKGFIIDKKGWRSLQKTTLRNAHDLKKGEKTEHRKTGMSASG